MNPSVLPAGFFASLLFGVAVRLASDAGVWGRHAHRLSTSVTIVGSVSIYLFVVFALVAVNGKRGA